MDLRAHLRRIHRLSPSDSRFIHAINSATICQKKVFYKSQFVGKLKMNSLEKIGSNGDIQSASDETWRNFESNEATSDPETNCITSSTSDDDSNYLPPVKSSEVSENSNSILPTSDSEFIIPTGDRFSSTIDEQNVHCQSGDSFIMEPSSLSPHKLEHRKPTNDQVLKKCSHPSITKLHSMKTRFKDGANKTNYKSIFNLIFDNSLFSSVFESQIQSVKEHSRISKVEIMDTARKSRQFAEFLRFLDSRFPLSIVESKIMDKVRGLGVSQRNQLDIPQMVYSPSGSNTTLSEFLYT